jgi:hypothetical protein
MVFKVALASSAISSSDKMHLLISEDNGKHGYNA